MPDENAKRQERFDAGWYAPIRHSQEAKTWDAMAYRAFQKQLAPKKSAPEGALFKDNPSSKESLRGA